MKKRVLSLIFVLCFVFGTVNVALSANAAVTLSGTGTESDPYIISTEEKLLAFADIVNGTNGATKNTSACGKVTESIGVSKNWTPMGTLDSPYSGTFVCEQGKEIASVSNLSLGGQIGFFGCTENAVIENVTLSHMWLHGEEDVGGVVGYAKNSVIKNCTVTGYSSNIIAGEESVGGIVGRSEDSRIVGCGLSNAKVQLLVTKDAAKHKVGGIVGVATLSDKVTNPEQAVLIENCVCNGSVFCISEDDYMCTGGIVGRLVSFNENLRATVKDCTNESDTVSSIEAGTGGIVGYARNAKITDCDNYSKVTGTYAVGGIAGYALYGSEVVNCNNYGDVSGEDYEDLVSGKIAYSQYIGGIVGSVYNPRGTLMREECGYEEIEPIHKDSLISNCHNEGDVTCTTAQTYQKLYIICNPDGSPYALSICGAYTGGIIGSAVDSAYFSEEGNKIVVKDCTNTGTVTGPNDKYAGIGGLIGASKNISISGCSNTGEVVYSDNDENDYIRDDIGINSYTVIFDAGDGEVTPSLDVAVNGKLASLPTPEKENDVFNGWFTSKDGGEQIDENTQFTQKTVAYARWENSTRDMYDIILELIKIIIQFVVLVVNFVQGVCPV